jgi:hypothetical protein
MNTKFNWIIGGVAVVALFLSLAGLIGGNNQSATILGASGTRFPNGISADTTSPVAGQVRGTDFTITSDLVSTKAGLCFNFYATSTDTLGKMTASTTATIEGVDGVMMFGYGSCQS